MTVCNICQDTHLMQKNDYDVPCIHCPLPCDQCRSGAFCKSTPCVCQCHWPDTTIVTVPEEPKYVSFDDFAKLEIRIGQIVKAEPVAKSKKLLKLEVYFGEVGTRTILAGIAQHYHAESLAGVRVMAVLNLAPREMFGIVSHGMVLAGASEGGIITLADCFGVPPGGKIG